MNYNLISNIKQAKGVPALCRSVWTSPALNTDRIGMDMV